MAKGSPEVRIFHPLGGAAAAFAFVEGFQRFYEMSLPMKEMPLCLFFHAVAVV